MTARGEARGVWRAWRPVAPPRDVAFDFGEIDALRREWIERGEEMRRRAPEAHERFMARLGRRWAIETGVIEGVYELDEAASAEMIEGGFFAGATREGAASADKTKLIAILIDQRTALDVALKWARDGLPLTKWLIRALHGELMRRQPTSRAMNQFGAMFDAPLARGEFKRRPNNPVRRDGLVHEYCPPEHVESEIERFVALLEEGAERGDHPLSLAAWAHHEFISIHPFQDGNGRVGRAALAWQLAAANMLPITVSRHDRTEYIDALESADGGDLTPLVALFVRLEAAELNGGLGAAASALDDKPGDGDRDE